MAIFEAILALLVIAVGLAALARRWNAPYPALLAGLGVVLALLPGLPGMPRIALDPQLALALFVAPVLLDAAFDTSTRDLRDNWLPIAALVIVAVFVTTAAVAMAAKWLVPDLQWAAAITLGAIVAPPDAAAATAVLKQARLPHRLTQILEGESLFNDATALLIYRVAVAAAMGDPPSLRTIPTLILIVSGSVVAGSAVAWLFTRVQHRVEDIPTAIVLQFAATFGVWIAAEHVGLSGILTIVAYAITLARFAPHTTPARIRVPSYAVWETMVFVLNVLAFVLIGLQLGPIVEHLSAEERGGYARVAGAVLFVVIVVRIAWVMLYNTAIRWKYRHFGATSRERPTARGGLMISWCGMRGIVTLAAALALPNGDHPFPGRSLILVTAFTVVVGTLVLQGLTLRPLLGWLDLHDDDPVEREVAGARQSALRAALKILDGDASTPAKALRFELEELLSTNPNAGRGDSHDPELPALRQRAVDAARAELKRMRFDESIGDDAYHRVEAVLDRTELYAAMGRTEDA
jgi:CPA1 family monovalent cation:H+ antiporter